MAKYSDRYRLGKSDISPYKAGETYRARHNRRKKTANDMVDVLQAFASENDMTLSVANNGHHFSLKNKVFVADWWPSTAKLVINKQWHKGFHCHDAEQFKRKVLLELRTGDTKLYACSVCGKSKSKKGKPFDRLAVISHERFSHGIKKHENPRSLPTDFN